ncbi:SH3 domain-containing protein [Paracoccus xiamenensis]|uniref:SH3 domain-containing protein n=1 Tax=Paracoccus xiamenensis TaxID=2714901 RepID=UPI00140C491D|nr:SH3 domain-containing protein [Paracoccus xiamenensis]NHF74737.1 SH3 domain-containing protein [Paracoccus xiamenensis]
MLGKMLRSAALAAVLAAPVWAESTTTPVHFGDGATGTAVTGQIAGRDTADFTVAASAGQKMSVQMITNNPSSYFNIYAPGDVPGESQALFIGSTSGLEAGITLPATGTYLIRTYLMANAGRENETARFSLTIDVGGTPQKAPTAAPAATPQPAQASAADLADSLGGGPDYWQVTGIAGRLNIRAEASTGASVVATVGNGDALRNQGCKAVDGRTWCKVETTAGQSGWTVNQYLREGAAPAAATGAAASMTTAATAPAPAARVASSARPPVPAPAKALSASDAPPASTAVSAAKPAPKPGQRGTARGSLPCSTALGMPTRDCSFTVTRQGEGNATVTVNWPDGGSRAISFTGGAPAPREGLRTERRGDLTVINLGNERYEIPDAVVNGG